MEHELIRDLAERERTFGKWFVEGKYLCETLEDTDRFLEQGGEKIPGKTAIPRGRYRLTVTFSPRFKRLMVLINGVMYFTGVRCHGGNDEGDTEGCPLLGQVRNINGPYYISKCAGVNERLVNMVEAATEQGQESWLTVK